MTSQVGLTLDEMQTPAFLVDKDKVRSNVSKILQLCDLNELNLRGQTKTHKTSEIAFMQTNGSKRGLVCSTLEECIFYINHGYDDILFGFPLQEIHFKEVYNFTNKLEEFHVLTDSVDIVSKLCQLSPPKGKKWSIFMKVDCGGNRVGIWHENNEDAIRFVNIVESSDTAHLKGVYVHCGNTYLIDSMSSAVKTRDETISILTNFVNELRRYGSKIPVVGIGSTPSCSHDGKYFKFLTEIHPGNYVFYDLQQQNLESCTQDDIAVCVATRVVGHYPRRNQMLIDCGFTALTKQGPQHKDFKYGVFKDEKSLRLVAMTQEIGFVESINGQIDFVRYPVGKMLFILPWHACATSNMYSKLLVIEDNKVSEEWLTVPRR